MQALQKQQLRVKRQGRVFTVFINTETDRPISIGGYDDEPPGGFPKIMSEQELLSHFGPRYDILPVDPPNPIKQVEVDGNVDEAVLNRVIEAGDKEAAARRAQLGIADDGRSRRLAEKRGEVPQAPAAAPIPPAPSRVDANGPLEFTVVQERVFRELETMFAKRSVAGGKLLKELNTEIQNVANFLLRIEPGLQPALVALSERHRNVQRIQF